MKIAAYVHPRRCTHPLGGVGRHAAGILNELAAASGMEVELLASRQWLDANGGLGNDSALPRIPVRTFPMRENFAERVWKTLGWPRIDRWVGDADWIYSPMESYLPAKRVPVAITIHDVQAFETNLPWSNTPHHHRWRAKWSVWIRKAIRDSRVIFTVSEFSKGRLVKLLGADAEKVVVVGNGIGPEFFSIERRLDLSKPPYALVLGGLRWKKGGASIIAVARELKGCESKLRVVTAGLNDPELVERASEFENLDVHGAISEEELHFLLGGASSLLFLSRYEGFGLPALEAMAAGVPVIASNCASIPEVAGDAAILVDPDDHRMIADTIEHLERDNQRVESLASAGRRRAARFTWDACAKRVEQALRANG